MTVAVAQGRLIIAVEALSATVFLPPTSPETGIGAGVPARQRIGELVTSGTSRLLVSVCSRYDPRDGILPFWLEELSPAVGPPFSIGNSGAFEVLNMPNAYPRSENGLAAGDFTGDGAYDLLFGAGGDNGFRNVSSVQAEGLDADGKNLVTYTSYYPEYIGENDPVAEEYVQRVGVFPVSKRYLGFAPPFRGQEFYGGVRVAIADLDGDGVGEKLYGAGPNGGPHVIIRNGRADELLHSFFAREEAYRGG